MDYRKLTRQIRNDSRLFDDTDTAKRLKRILKEAKKRYMQSEEFKQQRNKAKRIKDDRMLFRYQ